MVTKQDLIGEIESIGVVTCTLLGGDSFSIGSADYWLGGDAKYYMCDLLGNVEYTSVISIVNALFEYLNKIGESIEDMD